LAFKRSAGTRFVASYAVLFVQMMHILHLYSLAGAAEPIPLENCGGFSGARIWRGQSLTGGFCLKAWPESMCSRTLQQIHALMDRARQAGLDFVPGVERTLTGESTVEHAQRVWDVTTWMPGQADFHARPTAARLANACTALARLHEVWAGAFTANGPCPAVQRRLHRLGEWSALVESGWRPEFDRFGPVRFWAERGWEILPSRIRELPAKLLPWTAPPVALQPCLCDLWHDHVLFTGDSVSGIIDYGSVKVDNVAVDLARLLGSLVEDNGLMRSLGLDAYSSVRPLTAMEQRLVHILDETGTVLAAANWLIWLYHDGRRYDDLDAIARRMAALVRRIEEW
jgi:Ser/Thr protein kinase RdoA (MazF antagonist)